MDSEGKIIYIGKAKVLKDRVRSYFHKSGHAFYSGKVERMVARIAGLETIVTDSEVEALILEANLVKMHRPHYNILLKDDKSFPYIRITNELYPRVFMTRRIIQDGSKYFGPFTDVKPVKRTLATLKRLFPVRLCKLKISRGSVEKKRNKVCLNYHMQKCLGPCGGLISRGDYIEMIEQVTQFLKGKTSALVKDLQTRMKEASDKLEYEKAARFRDRIQAVKTYESNQKVVTIAKIDRDIIAVSSDDTLIAGIIFKVRDGKLTGKQHYQLTTKQEENITSIIKTVMQQYYISSEYVPGEIFLQQEPEDLDTLSSWLEGKSGRKVNIVIPVIGDKKKLLDMCLKNADLLLEELKIQQIQRRDYLPKSIQELQKDLKLDRLPRRIEAFDVSNISGREPVASMVCFINATPAKSEYRKFKIKTVEGANDYAMMAEAVERRYSRVLKENLPLPDLILVDGGKGQLSTIKHTLVKIGLENQPVIGLAKKLEEVFLPGFSDPQNIPKTSPGIKLLQRIRDESHRFAITYHRLLRKKRTIVSELDKIPGIGPYRQKLLLSHFGSVERLKAADYKDIVEVKGFSGKMAEIVFDYFHNNKD